MELSILCDCHVAVLVFCGAVLFLLPCQLGIDFLFISGDKYFQYSRFDEL